MSERTSRRLRIALVVVLALQVLVAPVHAAPAYHAIPNDWYVVTFDRTDAVNESLAISVHAANGSVTASCTVPAFGACHVVLPNGTYSWAGGKSGGQFVVSGANLTVLVSDGNIGMPPGTLPGGDDTGLWVLFGVALFVGGVLGACTALVIADAQDRKGAR